MVQPSRGTAYPQYRIWTRPGVPVAMRDGVRLSTDVYLDSQAEDAVYFATPGYAVVLPLVE